MNKTVPYDIDAEESVNGSLLIDGGAIREVVDLLQPEHFFSEPNKWIYEACVSLYRSSDSINQITIARKLDENNTLAKSGGVAYLSHLIQVTPTSFDIESYAEIVKRLATYRKMIPMADKITGIAYQSDGDINKSISEVITMAKSLSSDVKSKLYTGVNLADEIMNISNQTTDSLPLPWGDINKVTGGLFGGDLTVLGAWTGQGKTEFVLQILLWLAKKDYPVLLASLEMLEEQVAQRIISIETGISGLRLRTKETLTEDELTKIMNIGGMVSELPFNQLFIPASIQQIRATLDHAERKIRLVVVDYLTVLPEFFDRRLGSSPCERMNYIIHSLKQLAREYNIPVLALSQFNRQILDSRRGGLEGSGKSYPVPHQSYMKESGSIEQEADGIWTLFRPEINDNHKPEDDGITIFKQHKSRTTGDSDDTFNKIRLTWKDHKFYGTV